MLDSPHHHIHNHHHITPTCLCLRNLPYTITPIQPHLYHPCGTIPAPQPLLCRCNQHCIIPTMSSPSHTITSSKPISHCDPCTTATAAPLHRHVCTSTATHTHHAWATPSSPTHHHHIPPSHHLIVTTTQPHSPSPLHHLHPITIVTCPLLPRSSLSCDLDPTTTNRPQSLLPTHTVSIPTYTCIGTPTQLPPPTPPARSPSPTHTYITTIPNPCFT